MARGHVSTLFRVYASKKCASRFRALILNQYLSSSRAYECSPNFAFLSVDYVQNRSFSTGLRDLGCFRLHPQSRKLAGDDYIDVKPFSTSVEDGDGDLEDNNACNSEKGGDSDGDFDADSGKAINFELESGDRACSVWNGEGRDGDDEGLIFYSMTVESENGDDNVRTLMKPMNFMQIASRDPAELYRETYELYLG